MYLLQKSTILTTLWFRTLILNQRLRQVVNLRVSYARYPTLVYRVHHKTFTMIVSYPVPGNVRYFRTVQKSERMTGLRSFNTPKFISRLFLAIVLVFTNLSQTVCSPKPQSLRTVSDLTFLPPLLVTSLQICPDLPTRLQSSPPFP